LAAFTLGRLSLVPLIVLSFLETPALTVAAIALFVILDVFDGVLARRQAADGPGRRSLDSVVDRIGIDAGIVGAYAAGLLPEFLLVALLARDAYCGMLCARMMYRRRVAIKADWLYRGLNLCVALGAVAAPFVPTGLWEASAYGLLALSIVVAIDLTRCVRVVENSPDDVRTRVVGAGELRKEFG
jgi:phosphatidylglycerophosphate synthase